MEVNLWNRLQTLEKQFVAHKAAVTERTGHQNDLARDVADRLDSIEFNMSRLLLIVQTLAEICRGKNVFSEQEFESLMHAIDLSDGAADGGLNPNTIPGMQPVAQPTSFLSFLRQAEKNSADAPMDPSAYLAQLEQAE